MFSAYDVLPDYLKLYFQTQLNLDLKQASTDTARAYLRLELNNIRAHLKNVHFAYRRKVFPAIEDEGEPPPPSTTTLSDLFLGWCDVHLGGKGLSIRMDFIVATDDRNQTRLSVADVDATIDDLTINVKKVCNLNLVFGGKTDVYRPSITYWTRWPLLFSTEPSREKLKTNFR